MCVPLAHWDAEQPGESRMFIRTTHGLGYGATIKAERLWECITPQEDDSSRRRQCKIGLSRAVATTVESLESRLLLSTTWYVSASGSDSPAGSTTAPFATLQHAADVVHSC